ncbi:ATP-binding protein [Sphaerotilus sp.]|uniref:tetratricopeptide repeat protein n=1 Tax=Sphaerotilus sp. TaxID=2093942 RepID=UPI002ACD4774|nr:ATP-binding protein [Sphaerotilus sp.]MDZ7858808.1 ATP-binding protein [Sphaerotilus sp.]
MKQRLKALCGEAHAIKSAVERRMAYVAIVRLLLQHSAILLAERIAAQRMKSASQMLSANLPISSLREPADGTLLAALCEMLVIAENEGSAGISNPILRTTVSDRPCWRLLETNVPCSAERLLSAFVDVRNDGVEGHGLIGNNDLEAEGDALELIIEACQQILPVIDTNGETLWTQLDDGSRYVLRTLKAYSGNISCYRSIKRFTTDRCLVKAQIERGLFEREDVSYEIEDPFISVRSSALPAYSIVSTATKDWSPITLLPERLTKQFTGRERELEELRDWLDDSESRACMLFGDGGIGKTTLAVEFMHRLLDGTIKTSYKPELITFYTAKKTRWGLNGLELIRIADVGVADVATLIPRALDGKPLDRSWYVKDADAVIHKLATYLAKDWGVSRNNHLLILDNTETMASNAEEVKTLARQMRELSRRVGRILLTSRRREAIEANQVEIKPLSEPESVKFLRARAKVLDRKPILMAGDSTLTKYSRNLGCKPLVLEVFVGALGESGIGLESAYQRVQRMHTQDLGEFLYADAWNRTSHPMQYLLLLMTRVSEIHDDTLLKLCCGQVGISVLSAYDALEESRGIAQISRYQDDTQILFSSEFLKFCAQKEMVVDGKIVPNSASVEKVKSRYAEFLKSRSAKVSDRIDRAYRHAYARAANTAYREGRDEDCEAFYELALSADPDNGWLYDRYAVFLSSKYPARRAEALDWAKKSTHLIPNDGDAWYTRGILEAKLRIAASIDSLDRAAANGKPKHLCLLQQARAYLAEVPPNKALARATLTASMQNEPKSGDPLLWKYRSERAGLERAAAESDAHSGADSGGDAIRRATSGTHSRKSH